MQCCVSFSKKVGHSSTSCFCWRQCSNCFSTKDNHILTKLLTLCTRGRELTNREQVLIAAASKDRLLVNSFEINQEPVFTHLGDLKVILPNSPGCLGKVVERGGPLDDLSKRLDD